MSDVDYEKQAIELIRAASRVYQLQRRLQELNRERTDAIRESNVARLANALRESDEIKRELREKECGV